MLEAKNKNKFSVFANENPIMTYNESPILNVQTVTLVFIF